MKTDWTLSHVDTSEAAPTGAPQAPVDLEGVLARCLSDAAFCADLLRKFTVSGRELSSAIERAFEAQDRNALAAAVHDLKGLAGNISAEALHAWAASLECALHRGTVAAVRPLVRRVQREIDRCILAVPALLNELASRA